ncbi:MAG TPA: HEAT repeat domain-containing protein [Gemmatimonadaceae bacterium]|nr:HEAT repeat domain-containing protein [Gemmatimonadaceae bacterium]
MTTPSLRRTMAFKAIDLPQGYAAVEELMRLMVKAVRAQQLYAANNPMHKAALEALRAGFARVWEETPELVLTVGETELQWQGVSVLADPVKSSDSLAWLFYKDGIRELRLARGIEEAEIVRFLDILGRARKATIDSDDLVTMLWEAELTGLSYSYRDAQADEVETGDISRVKGPAGDMSPEEVQLGVEQSVAASQGRRSGVVNMADFDQTLYFLDEREIDYLKREVGREYEQDLRTNIVAALLDIFEQQSNDVVREECLDYVETMLAFLLASGNFRGVAYLLGETRAAASRPGDLSPRIRQRIDGLPDRLSAPEAVEQLLEALDDAPMLPPRDELTLLFEQLRPGALGTVFRWLPKVRDDRLGALVTEVAGRLAASNTAELVKLVDSPDIVVSNEAMRRAGALKAQAAVGAIGRILTDADPRRRQIAAQALAEIGSAGAMQSLERALGDTDRDVRVMAMRAMAAGNHRPATARLEAFVRGREIRDADITEKTAAFETYGSLCGDSGVPHLDAILNGKGFLGKRDDSSMRAAAAMGLGRVNSAKAREALQKSAADKEPVVRNAVAKALRGGGGGGGGGA